MAVKYAKRMDLFKKSELGEILKLIEEPDIISFAGGLPASELFPVEEMKKVSVKVLDENGEEALQYSGDVYKRQVLEYLSSFLLAIIIKKDEHMITMVIIINDSFFLFIMIPPDIYVIFNLICKL